MITFDVEVKPFSTSEVYISLHYGQLVDGTFHPQGQIYQEARLKTLYTRSTSGRFGKPSYSQLYHFTIPEAFPSTIAGRRRTCVGTTQVHIVYDILFSPSQNSPPQSSYASHLHQAPLNHPHVLRNDKKGEDSNTA